ncbi:MAG: hypothetical protein JXR89_03340 [Deltaproteobacteria bacterium]|nr:hypothetical protein [Deltaproteobacteria bacterium]
MQMPLVKFGAEADQQAAAEFEGRRPQVAAGAESGFKHGFRVVGAGKFADLPAPGDADVRGRGQQRSRGRGRDFFPAGVGCRDNLQVEVAQELQGALTRGSAPAKIGPVDLHACPPVFVFCH